MINGAMPVTGVHDLQVHFDVSSWHIVYVPLYLNVYYSIGELTACIRIRVGTIKYTNIDIHCVWIVSNVCVKIPVTK